LFKWNWLLKIYRDWKENIYSLDTNKIIFDKWYDYINTAKIERYNHIYNYIIFDNNFYYLSDINGNIVSKWYNNIEQCDSREYNILSVSLWGVFNFLTPQWKELSEIWFDDCDNFKNEKFTNVYKWKRKNFLSINWKLISNYWFDELIYKNEKYAIVKIDDKELIVWNYWEFEYEKNIYDNKYFQDKVFYDDYINDKEFISLFVYLDYYMSKSYNWPYDWMRDYTLWFKDSELTLKNLQFILNNYESYKNVYSFINEKYFINNFHDKLVWRREALLSSAIYYLIESSEELKKKYDSNKYRNLCLVYMDSFFKDLLQWYKDEWYYWWDEDSILWEMMYDVVYRENIYLSYSDSEWTLFCTWWYLDCIK
jgi:hypothetical protein